MSFSGTSSALATSDVDEEKPLWKFVRELEKIGKVD